MPRAFIPDHIRLKILRLRSKGKLISEIVAALKEEDDFPVHRNSVSKFLARFQESRSLSDQPRPGPKPQHVNETVRLFIDSQMEQNDETTATDLQRAIFERFELDFSLTKVKRLRRANGWIPTGTRYCQLVREVNRAKGLEFCQRCLDTGESFDDVIFTDESSIFMENHGKLTFRRSWEPPKLKGRPKHPYKVHVWGGISKRGATSLAIFTGLMDAEFYVNGILKTHLKPFIEQVFPDGHRFQQDNDPKHTSKRAREYYTSSGVNWWPTPPESPDLNPIENVWHELKHHLRKVYKPTTKQQLLDGIQEFWSTKVTSQKCHKYIGHLRKVVPRVIEREGRATEFWSHQQRKTQPKGSFKSHQAHKSHANKSLLQK